jgi:uncharacterized protein (DUF362 family)
MDLGRRDFLKRTGASAALLAAGSGMLKTGSVFAMNPAKFQAKSDISFVGSSSTGTRRQMIKDVLEPWRQTVATGIAGKTILIKPNLVYLNPMSTNPAEQILPLTHVDAIRGLIDFLRSISSTAPIVISDIPAYANPGLTTIMTAAGYDALTSEYSGVTLADLSVTTDFPSVNKHFWTPSFSSSSPVTIPISSVYTNSKYYIVSIVRPKTHNCMIMTGVNKNVLMGAPLNTGTQPNTSKSFMHGQSGWNSGQHTDENKCLSYNLFQMANIIYSTGAPALAVLDAWEGMEGDGPVSGTSIMQYCAAAGIDPLAVDRISAKLMGFSDTAVDPINTATPSYTDMRALVWISNAGFGNYDLSKINFILGSLATLNTYVKSYKLHSNYTGTPSYETNWTGGPPPSVFDASGIKDSRYLDPKPYLAPQVQNIMTAGDIKIDFSLPVSFPISLGIFTMKGEEIRRIGVEHLPSGRYSVIWNRRNDSGSRVPAGQYIIKLGFGSHSLCDRISVMN